MDAIAQNHSVLNSTWWNVLCDHNSGFEGVLIAIAQYSTQLQGNAYISYITDYVIP